MKLEDWEVVKRRGKCQLVHLHRDRPEVEDPIFPKIKTHWSACFSINDKVWVCVDCFEEAPKEIVNVALLGKVLPIARLSTDDPLLFLEQYEDLKVFFSRGGWHSFPLKGLGGNREVLRIAKWQVRNARIEWFLHSWIPYWIVNSMIYTALLYFFLG